MHHPRPADSHREALNPSTLSPCRSHRKQARSDVITTTPEIQKLDAPLTQDETIASLGRYGYGWSDSDVAGASAQRGLSEAVVRDISAKKSEPEWMLETRLKALRIFDKKQ